jgi:hypothetical protein
MGKNLCERIYVKEFIAKTPLLKKRIYWEEERSYLTIVVSISCPKTIERRQADIFEKKRKERRCQWEEYFIKNKHLFIKRI